MRSNRNHRAAGVVAVLAAVGLAGVPASAATSDLDGSRGARATVRNTSGASLGTVNIQPSGGKLVISGRLSGLAPGFHGYHIHAVGICNPRAVDPTGAVVPFFTAGGHLNPGGTGHGTHGGDLPLLRVSADGTALSVSETDGVTLAQILDADGGAIIIHAAPDNYAHIPARYSAAGVPGPDAATLATGDAGGRFACGIIVRS